MTILHDILAAKRRRLAAGEFAPRGVPALASDGSRFLANGGLIAEIKHRSPSAGVIVPGLDARVERIAHAYRRGGAAAISVVVEHDFFGGDPAWLPRVKAASGLPVLMKDFVVDEQQLDFALSLGADAVLLIVSALTDDELARLHRAARSRGLAVLVEAHDADEVRRAAACGAEIVGVNARDLKTFRVDLDAMARLGAALPAGVVKVAESGIARHDDVVRMRDAGYGAFLVGESLLRRPEPARAVRELLGVGPTDVKVCGLTRAEDVAVCREAGVDAIGLNFSPRSPRRVTLAEAEALADRSMTVVAVFSGNVPSEIREVAERLRPDILQLTEPPAGETWPLPVWQTVRVGRDDLAAAGAWPGEALLYDTAVAGQSGGTGTAFDWSVLETHRPARPFLLAGGLRPENVREAVWRVRPHGVDVASGVESSPGVKDARKIAHFVSEVRNA